MSLRGTLRLAVDQAFAAVGDLVSTATLTRVTEATYNWTTGETENDSATLTVEAILTDTSEESGESATSPTSTVLIRSRDLQAGNLYSTLALNGTVYRIESLELYEGIAILKVRNG